MKRAIEGDEQAFLSVMLAQKTDLYRTAFSFLKNEHDAIEAVQEVTFRAYKNFKGTGLRENVANSNHDKLLPG